MYKPRFQTFTVLEYLVICNVVWKRLPKLECVGFANLQSATLLRTPTAHEHALFRLLSPLRFVRALCVCAAAWTIPGTPVPRLVALRHSGGALAG